MKCPKFQVFKSSKNQQYYFRLLAKNGEIILASEGYTTKYNCIKGIQSVKKHASNKKGYSCKNTTSHYSFVLKANNYKTIGHSESYTSKQAREKGIQSVEKNAPIADIEILDKT